MGVKPKRIGKQAKLARRGGAVAKKSKSMPVVGRKKTAVTVPVAVGGEINK